MIKFFATLVLFSTVMMAAYAQWPFIDEALLSEVVSRHFDPKLIGGGVVVFDYNNDGHEDLYFTGGIYSDKLFRNRGNGKFEDVSQQLGITAGTGAFKTVGAVSGDLNNDGFKDLIITTDKNAPNLVLRNIGGTSFEVLTPFPDDPNAWSSSVILADYNKDSYLDVYFFNYVKYDMEPFFQWRTSGTENVFYQNNGNFQFTDITQKTNTKDSGAGLAGTFSDFDSDGDADLFVVNDFGYEFGSNTLLINKFPDDEFSPIESTSKVKAAIDGMGIAIGDYNEDGFLDYYVSNFQENLLLTNRENSFDEDAKQKNIEVKNEVSWGTFFFDFNNDSYLDLFVANGSMTDPDVLHENRLFQQDSEGQFVDVTPSDLAYNKNTARGAAFGDLNNDGFPDVVVVKVADNVGSASSPLLYINHSNNHNNWFKLKLTGTISNKDAYGANIKVYAEGRVFTHEIQGGSSYLSQNSSIAHFGLANISGIDSLLISWPNGLKETHRNLQVNKFMEAIENEGLAQANVSEPDIILDVDENKINNKLKLYPNPFNNQVQVIFNNVGPGKNMAFYLFNNLGKQVDAINKIEKTKDNTYMLYLDEKLPVDMYVLKIENGHEIFNKKIIKQH